MNKFIGQKLETVLKFFNENGYMVNIIDNNYNVCGDTSLVTNIVAKDKTVDITVGSFIFDVRNKNRESK